MLKMSSRDKLQALVALSTIPTVGGLRFRHLMKLVKHPAEIFELSPAKIKTTGRIGQKAIDSILGFDDWNRVDELISAAKESAVHLVSIFDENYPERLRQIDDPPFLLWVRGDVAVLNQPGIAVVGTRRPSTYGGRMARHFTEDLASAGLVVFSGLAYGVDTTAHKVSVETGGKTVAVLGSSVDWIYPSTNKPLVEQILKTGGAVISEYPLGTKPEPGHFPVRNRIISGLSLGVLVVETGLKGGSRITARTALDQNREVFIVPHAVDSETGIGCNDLIKRGLGKLVQNTADIFDELEGYSLADKGGEKEDSLVKTPPEDSFQYQIWQALETGEIHIDSLAITLQTTTSKLLPALLEMEFSGYISQRPGKYFQRQK